MRVCTLRLSRTFSSTKLRLLFELCLVSPAAVCCNYGRFSLVPMKIWRLSQCLFPLVPAAESFYPTSHVCCMLVFNICILHVVSWIVLRTDIGLFSCFAEDKPLILDNGSSSWPGWSLSPSVDPAPGKIHTSCAWETANTEVSTLGHTLPPNNPMNNDMFKHLWSFYWYFLMH